MDKVEEEGKEEGHAFFKSVVRRWFDDIQH